jgi:hypothetical protein
MQRACTFVAAILAAVWTAGCNGSDGTQPCGCDTTPPPDDAAEAVADEATGEDAAADEAAADEADAAACEPADAATVFGDMYRGILHRLLTEVPVNEGDWAEDFGDATAFAPPALLSVGLRACDAEVIDLAVRTLEHEVFLVDHFLEVMEGTGAAEVLIGGIGLIEAYRLNPDARWSGAADELLLYLNDMVDLFGDYLYAPGLDVEPYGPTAVTGIIAAENLRYVDVVDRDDDAKVERALEIAAAVDLHAWDEAGGFYRASPDEPELDLYPNVAMMLVWTLAHRLTGEAGHLARAEALFEAIQPLRLEALGAYHSLYSSSVPDYVSLSSQNYLVLALMQLAEETGDANYVDEATTLLRFIESNLYWNGMAWHHWESGARATWYCSGCNFQLLYDLWLVTPAG